MVISFPKKDNGSRQGFLSFFGLPAPASDCCVSSVIFHLCVIRVIYDS